MAEFTGEGLSPEEAKQEIAAELDDMRDATGRLINTPESQEVLSAFIAGEIDDEYSAEPEADVW